MKSFIQHNRKAMTLVEVMVSTGVISLIMGGLTVMYMVCTKVSSAGMAQLAVQAKARQGLDAILYDVKRSESATIYTSYPTYVTNSDSGSYIIFQIPVAVAGATNYHHYYIGNLTSLGNGITNGTLYYFGSTNGTTIPASSTHREIVRGITNPDRVFDWINGVVNINIRVADENDVNGKQIIYLRSAVAFRN